MKRKSMNLSKALIVWLGAFGVALALLAADGCLTWDDPPCALVTSHSELCGGCSTYQDFPVVNRGTHWVIVVVSDGFPQWDWDTECTYVCGYTCPSCSSGAQTFTELGAKDQLPYGTSCHPAG